MSNFSKKILGKNIKQARKNKNITQEQLADMMCVTTATISSWERGINSPGIAELDDLAMCLGVTIYEMIESSRVEKNSKIENIVGIVLGVSVAAALIASIVRAPKVRSNPISGNQEDILLNGYWDKGSVYRIDSLSAKGHKMSVEYGDIFDIKTPSELIIDDKKYTLDYDYVGSSVVVSGIHSENFDINYLFETGDFDASAETYVRYSGFEYKGELYSFAYEDGKSEIKGITRAGEYIVEYKDAEITRDKCSLTVSGDWEYNFIIGEGIFWVDELQVAFLEGGDWYGAGVYMGD